MYVYEYACTHARRHACIHKQLHTVTHTQHARTQSLFTLRGTLRVMIYMLVRDASNPDPFTLSGEPVQKFQVAMIKMLRYD